MTGLRSSKLRPGNVLATIPSAYGAATWLLALLLYSFRVLPWYPSVLGSELLLWSCGIAFLLSSLCCYLPYRNWLREFRLESTAEEMQRTGKTFQRTLMILHMLGLIGVALYVYDFAAALGGYGRFLSLLIEQSYMIRWQAEFTRSAGTQLSYFGWPAMAITVVLCIKRRLPRKWLVWAALQFLGNCLFIGRTRPIWLLLTTVLLCAPMAGPLSLKRILFRGTAVACLLLFLFVGMGVWVGKISTGIVADPNSPLPGTLQNFYLYMTGGFAYFDGIYKGETLRETSLERTAYPLYRLLAVTKLGQEPASQINDFLWLPYSTNVGTALEPFYRDGGVGGAVLGIILITIGTDLIALWLWQANRLLSWFAAANLCFSSALAFFTPKLHSLPVWMFIAMAAVTMIMTRRPKASREARTAYGPPPVLQPTYAAAVSLTGHRRTL